MIKSFELQNPCSEEAPNIKLQSIPADRIIGSATDVTLEESSLGLPHSMTLSRFRARRSIREVLECGSPIPLSTEITRPAGPIPSPTAANVAFALEFRIWRLGCLWSLELGVWSF